MRRQSPQLSLNCQGIEHDHAKELAMIDAILSGHPRIKELVEQDLLAGLSCPEIGAPGMTGDQVFRALIIKQMNGFSYSELAFHLADSITYRTFCGYGAFDEVPSRSTLAKNIKRVCQETIEEVNRVLVDHARTEGTEQCTTPAKPSKPFANRPTSPMPSIGPGRLPRSCVTSSSWSSGSSTRPSGVCCGTRRCRPRRKWFPCLSPTPT